MTIVKILMVCVGGIVAVFSILCLGISMLGFVGVLADEGTDENYRMGYSVLVFSIPFLVSAAILLIGALLMHLYLEQSSTRNQSPTSNSELLK